MVAKIVPGGRYLLFQLEKKGGDQIFQRGDRFYQKILVPPDHFFLKYLVRGDLFWGGTNCYVTDLKARRRPRGTLQLETRRGGTSDLATSIR